MVSGTRTLTVGALRPVVSEVGPPWIKLVPARPTDAPSDRDLGYLEARSMP